MKRAWHKEDFVVEAFNACIEQDFNPDEVQCCLADVAEEYWKKGFSTGFYIGFGEFCVIISAMCFALYFKRKKALNKHEKKGEEL